MENEKDAKGQCCQHWPCWGTVLPDALKPSCLCPVHRHLGKKLPARMVVPCAISRACQCEGLQQYLQSERSGQRVHWLQLSQGLHQCIFKNVLLNFPFLFYIFIKVWSGQLLLLHLRKIWSQGWLGGWGRRLTLYLSTSHYPLLCLYPCPLPGSDGSWGILQLPPPPSSLTPIQDGFFSIRSLVFISHVKGKPGKNNIKFGFNKDTWG